VASILLYVFCIRAGKGFTPIYVGKAAKQSFEAEAFTAHKLANHYNPALRKYRGTPVMFFVAYPKTKGKINEALIDQVETFFIDAAYKKNPELRNVRKKPECKWRIRGVVRAKSGEGKNSAASEFRQAVGLD
jgi:hypothetical protein